MESRSFETFNYLRRHYFNDAKLRNLALSEFVKAMRSGRLIGFTGSFTTTDFGYPKWKDLLTDALDASRDVLTEHHLLNQETTRLVRTLKKQAAQPDQGFDARVAFSAVTQLLDHLSDRAELSKQALAKIAGWFSHSRTDRAGTQTNIAALFEALGIDRVVTTNYDLELEAYAMDLRPPLGHSEDRWDVWAAITDLKSNGWLDREGDVKDGHSLVLNLANGDRIVSDLMQRDRAESLVEFAIGCPENDKHIFHLHGRADQPESLILSYRDYDRLYRRRGLGKLPFEHALRILFAGNPVLFVGLGMSEPELNKTLSEFVGDQPYARKAPAFLIWDSLPPIGATAGRPGITAAERRAAFRLDKLHRLGVLTIFADDLPPAGAALSPRASADERLSSLLHRLTRFAVRSQKRRLATIPPRRWRNALARLQRRAPIVNTWNVSWSRSAARILAPPLDEGLFMRVMLLCPGASKTGLANALADEWNKAGGGRRAAILNFNMRIDTDSILALISDLFRYDETTGDLPPRTVSREQEFSDPGTTGLRSGDRLLIVLKGIERIFDVNGHPLSAEFDRFLRTVAARGPGELNLQFAVIGTDRIRSYFEGLKEAYIDSPILIEEVTGPSGLSSSVYLRSLQQDFEFSEIEKAKLKNREHSAFAAQRRTLYHTVLSPAALEKHGFSDAELALEILSVVAFIGQPVEPAILFHAPVIQKRLEERLRTALNDSKARLGASRSGDDLARLHFWETFNDLISLRLLSEINKMPGRAAHERRFAVHLSLQSEMRDRNGVPLSDSILSTAYNMSLFAAQPGDGALPEPNLHDELGKLVDWLLGAFRDPPLDPAAEPATRWRPHVVAALRAALSVVRGLYSTSALLSVDRGDRLIREGRDGLLAEHAARLERILNAFEETCRARESQSSTRTRDELGAEPLYPDEIVWLHNERGVVKLAQGDLYEARFSFDEAERMNRAYVEFDHPSHNWRRITLNQVVVDIERGRLQSADDRMNAIERALGGGRANHIRTTYLDGELRRRIGFDANVSHEDILSMALITGYRGLTSHLRGELGAARNNFDRAIHVLERMDEQRALALFRRHKASLYSDLGDVEEMKREARLAIAGAESVRQLDIVYAGRLIEAYAARKSKDASERAGGIRASLEVLEYATMSEMHRLSIEAHLGLAHAKFDTSDFDAAIEHVSEALAIATRYGLSLYKVTLRTMMGRILVRRGNVGSGQTLIRNAMNGAVRIGYQRAIESARRVLAEASAEVAS